MKNLKPGKAIFVFACLTILFILTTANAGQKSILGDWKLTIENNPMVSMPTLSVSRATDGTIQCRWGSGESRTEITGIKYEDNRLSFTRTLKWRDRQFSSNFNVTFNEQTDTLSGNLSSASGDMPVTATRIIPKIPALGTWVITTERQGQIMESRLTISIDPNGLLTGSWQSQRGESKISNVKCEDGKLAFTREISFGERQFEMDYQLEIKGNDLTGTIITERGERQISGKRAGSELIGSWNLDITSDMGNRAGSLVIENDYSGTIDTGFGEMEISDLKLEDKNLTFSVSFGFGDRQFTMDFTGTLEEETIKGTLSSERGDSQVTGKKAQTEQNDPNLP